MNFTHTPKFADYWMLNKRHLLKIRGVKILIPMAICFLIYFLLSPVISNQYSSKSTIDSYLSSWPFLILPIVIFYLPFTTYRAAKKRWGNTAELRCEKRYEIFDSGMRITGEGFDSSIEWQYFKSVEISRGWIFIVTYQGVYYYFPVSVIPEPEKLFTLLKTKVGKPKM